MYTKTTMAPNQSEQSSLVDLAERASYQNIPYFFWNFPADFVFADAHHQTNNQIHSTNQWLMVTLVWLLILSSSMIRALFHVHSKSWILAAKRINVPRYHSSFGRRFMSSSSSFTSAGGGSDGVLSPTSTAPVPPSSLLTYLRTRMMWGLETWKPSEVHRTASIEDAATTIVNFLLTTHYYHDSTTNTSSGNGVVATAVVAGPEQSSSESTNHPSSKERNKRLMDFGLTFAKALHANPGHLEYLLSDANPERMQNTLSEGDPLPVVTNHTQHPLTNQLLSLTSLLYHYDSCVHLYRYVSCIVVVVVVAVVMSVMLNYQRYIEKNKAVFLHINTHHESLGKQSWDTAVQDEQSLQTYAGAAKAMGEKQWVRDGNAWMENFALSFFRRNGARKQFIRVTYPQDKGQGLGQGQGKGQGKGKAQGLGLDPGFAPGTGLGKGEGGDDAASACAWSTTYAASSTLPINTLYQYSLSTLPIDTPYRHSLSTLSIKTQP